MCIDFIRTLPEPISLKGLLLFSSFINPWERTLEIMRCSLCTHSHSKTYKKAFSLVFSVIFLVQLGILISNYVNPTNLNTVMEIAKLDQLDKFPLVFQFCLRPGFDKTVLYKHGYSSIDGFFWGIALAENESDVGWDGKNTSISPAGKGSHQIFFWSNLGFEKIMFILHFRLF